MPSHSLIVVSFLGFLGLSACNGVSGENGSDPFNPDDSSSTSAIKLGYFDQSGQFVEGEIGVTLAAVNGVVEISAGGSVGLDLALVDDEDQRVSDTFSVELSSTCIAASLATVDTDITLVNGEASSTYTDQGCAGSAGTQDQISASVLLATNETLIATRDITIRPEAVGSISFQTAASDAIFLRGAGNDSDSQTSVSYLVLNQNGTPLAGQMVDFSLTTRIGGITLFPISAATNEDGLATTVITAGNVPTSVRVDASIISVSGETLKTQSSAINLTTGLPSQRTFTLSADILNVEGQDVDGETSNITARLSDTFGNPVPNDTVVNFTAEGGQIGSSCLTVDGACSVTWTSSNPRASNGRVTILATAVGHETLFDSNGNNALDDDDGGLIVDEFNTASGFGTVAAGTTGFVDFSEAWRDDNENLMWDSGETFLDYNDNQMFDQGDGLFNGVQCISTILCGSGEATALNVRKSMRLLVSGSEAFIDVLNGEEVIFASNYQSVTDQPSVEIARGDKVTLSAITGDVFANVLPANTVFAVSSDQGDLKLTSAETVANTSALGRTEFLMEIENTLADDQASVVATVQILVTTPRGTETRFSFPVTLL